VVSDLSPQCDQERTSLRSYIIDPSPASDVLNAVFPIGVEHGRNVAVQRPHDAYPRQLVGPPVRRDQNQSFHRRLPLWLGVRPPA
jgi:hypothetical protein